jgi:hypothetical protein
VIHDAVLSYLIVLRLYLPLQTSVLESGDELLKEAVQRFLDVLVNSGNQYFEWYGWMFSRKQPDKAFEKNELEELFLTTFIEM